MQPLFPKSEPHVQRGTQKYCEICSVQFSVINREHQCKRCLRAVCSDCGKSKNLIFSSNAPVKEVHRACKICKSQSMYIGTLIRNHNLQFGKMSTIGSQWSKRTVRKSVEPRQVSIKSNLFTRETFSQLWKAYSYELRELVGLLTQKYQEVSIYNMVYNVFTAVISASPATSLSKIVYLIIFVLCFCEPHEAALVVIELIQLNSEEKNNKNLAFKYLKEMPFFVEYSSIEPYISSRFDRFFDSFLVNCCNIECCIFIIS